VHIIQPSRWVVKWNLDRSARGRRNRGWRTWDGLGSTKLVEVWPEPKSDSSGFSVLAGRPPSRWPCLAVLPILGWFLRSGRTGVSEGLRLPPCRLPAEGGKGALHCPDRAYGSERTGPTGPGKDCGPRWPPRPALPAGSLQSEKRRGLGRSPNRPRSTLKLDEPPKCLASRTPNRYDLAADAPAWLDGDSPGT
jgi:hypothetical protein